MFIYLHRISDRLRAAKGRLAGLLWLEKPSLFAARRTWRQAMMFLIFGSAVETASAQEALRNMYAGQSAAEANAAQLQNQEYTFKNGDFRMLVTPSLSGEWNDNINLSENNLEDDYIITPGVGINSSYPLTEQNVLFLNISIGYRRYLKHPKYSSFDINSRSQTGLAFNIGIKNVTLNLHDWFSYEQDSAQSAAVANTANYGTFQNTAGLSATWDLNQVTLSAGYDHQNVLSTSGQYNYLDHAAELFFARAGFQVHPRVDVGLESTASLTTYSQSYLNNNQAYTVGPYMTVRPGDYFQATARGGYTIYNFDQTSQTLKTSNQNTWYVGLNISHQLRESVQYALDAGHETTLGTYSDLNEDWYVRPNVTWMVVRDLTFNTDLFYQHGKQGEGSTGYVPGSSIQKETYDWYGGDFSLRHPLTSHLDLSLTYRLTLRSSDQPNLGYTQNLVGLELTYHPK